MSAGSSGFSISQPFGGSGMDLNSAGRILDPLGIFGGGGMNKTAAEAFFDPAGIDSNGGLNLFGKAGQNNQSNIPQTPAALGNLGQASMQPHFYDPNSFAPRQMTGGSFNQMAQQMAGPQYMPQLMGAPQTSIPSMQSAPGMQQSMPPSGGAVPGGSLGHPNPPIGHGMMTALKTPYRFDGEPNPQIGPGMMPAPKARYGFGGVLAANSTRPMPPQMPANWYSSSIGGGIPGGI